MLRLIKFEPFYEGFTFAASYHLLPCRENVGKSDSIKKNSFKTISLILGQSAGGDPRQNVIKYIMMNLIIVFRN